MKAKATVLWECVMYALFIIGMCFLYATPDHTGNWYLKMILSKMIAAICFYGIAVCIRHGAVNLPRE